MIEGQTDISKLLSHRDLAVREQARAAVAFDEALRGRMSPSGALGLPELLDMRRLQYGIPDGAFKAIPAFERVYVYQIGELVNDTYGDTSIVVPDEYREKSKKETARGVVVGAGLTALDYLASHGMKLGDVVHFIRMAPFQRPIEVINGRFFYVIVMNAGDITGSEDTAERVRTGQLSIEAHAAESGAREHRYRWVNEEPSVPYTVRNPEEY